MQVTIKPKTYTMDSETRVFVGNFHTIQNPDLPNRLGMKGYDAIKNDNFFKGISWDWEDMKKVLQLSLAQKLEE